MLDYLLAQDGDIDLEAGDLQLVEPTEQHKRDLLIAGQGHYKETPQIGVDSVEFLLDSEPDDFLRTVRIQCARDGMKVEDVYIDDNGELTIDAGYESS